MPAGFLLVAAGLVGRLALPDVVPGALASGLELAGFLLLVVAVALAFVPVVPRWIAINSPASRVRSHGVHFQLMDRPRPLVAAGLPFLFSGVRIEGSADREGVPANEEAMVAAGGEPEPAGRRLGAAANGLVQLVHPYLSLMIARRSGPELLGLRRAEVLLRGAGSQRGSRRYLSRSDGRTRNGRLIAGQTGRDPRGIPAGD